MSLPSFRYHPNPTESGSIVSSAAECRSCGGSRGHIYIGPVYSEEDLADAICPWCIADGSAHRKFDAVFVDAEAFADAVPEAVVAEVTERTPGYSSWQSEVWPTCCGDATAFIMPAGISELRARSLTGRLRAEPHHLQYGDLGRRGDPPASITEPGEWSDGISLRVPSLPAAPFPYRPPVTWPGP